MDGGKSTLTLLFGFARGRYPRRIVVFVLHRALLGGLSLFRFASLRQPFLPVSVHPIGATVHAPVALQECTVIGLKIFENFRPFFCIIIIIRNYIHIYIYNYTTKSTDLEVGDLRHARVTVLLVQTSVECVE